MVTTKMRLRVDIDRLHYNPIPGDFNDHRGIWEMEALHHAESTIPALPKKDELSGGQA